MMTASAMESDSFGMVSSRATSALVLELAGRELARERSRQAPLAHPLELLAALALEVVHLRGRDALGLELGAQARDRVTGLPVVELPLGPVGAGVAARVTDEAVRQRLDEGRAAARPCVRDGTCGGLADRPDAHPVDRLRREPQRPRPPPH